MSYSHGAADDHGHHGHKPGFFVRWFCSTNHKDIGTLYLGFAVIAGARILPVAMLGTVVTGLGLGLIVPNQTVWLMAHVPEEARGRASGLMTTLLFAGQFVSPLVSGALLTRMELHTVFLAFALVAFASAGLLRITGRGTR